MNKQLPLVLLGAGGHAKVLLSLARAAGLAIVGVCDPELTRQGIGQWRGVPVLGGDDALAAYTTDEIGLINGIGQLVGSRLRQHLFEKFTDQGFLFPALIHPSAWVDENATLSNGVQVMAGAIIQPDCTVGQNSIINTRASLDHDCVIGAHVHIAPGATLCGGVYVQDQAFIGSGATVLQGLIIGAKSVAGAGVTLARNLACDQIVLGPAMRKKLVQQNKQENQA